jgi:hypothetical protein
MLINGCDSTDDEDVVSSRAYKGHENDMDVNNFVRVYPHTVGTRLDDCQTCHTGGTVVQYGDKIRDKNPCDFCHYIPFPDNDVEGAPASYWETLNEYGKAYDNAGSSEQALREIEDQDSDGDGYSNKDEIGELKYPGNETSMPGQPWAPIETFTINDLKSMTAHEEFLLVNSHKQEFDFYATYKGIKVKDLMTHLGVNLEEITGITVIAPDGYMKDFSTDAIQNQYPDGLYYSGLDTETLGPDCGFVLYPEELPEGLSDGEAIPCDQYLLLAYERDGGDMEKSYLDPTSGSIEGEGPFRIIVPQSEAGSPDRGSSYSPTNCNDGYDYDDTKDHNAGSMVRGVIAIRINPMPGGYEEFDTYNGGWAYVDDSEVIIYGHGIN